MTDSEKCVKCGMIKSGHRYYCEETGRYECADCVVAGRDKALARVRELEARLEAVRGWHYKFTPGWSTPCGDDMDELRAILDTPPKEDQ